MLVEDDGREITVTVRDDGPGIAEGRLEEAERQGRLGVAQSIRGRVHDLGGVVTITSEVLSHRTVQNHVQNTLAKLQLHNRVELTRYAIDKGIDR